MLTPRRSQPRSQDALTSVPESGITLLPSPYPVTVEEVDGAEDIKLASHEELDGQFPGQR